LENMFGDLHGNNNVEVYAKSNSIYLYFLFKNVGC
jgi:hypothetical protein